MVSARDDYPDLGTLRDAYIDGTPQFGGFEAGRALAEIDWLRQSLGETLAAVFQAGEA